MNECPRCQGQEQQVKAGRNPSGSQRYRCKGCGCKYTPAPTGQGYSSAVREQAHRMYLDGMNLRRIARHLGVVHQTVANWVSAAADRLPAQPAQPEQVETAELDALFTFVGSKKPRLHRHRGRPCDPLYHRVGRGMGADGGRDAGSSRAESSSPTVVFRCVCPV